MNELLQLDGKILVWIQETIRTDRLTEFFTFVTHLGDHAAVWILIAIVCLLISKLRKTGILMAASLLGSLLINNLILKNAVARTRPYEAVEGLHRIIEAQPDFSFPSGHTASSFAAAVVIFLTCPRKAGVPAVALAALIMLSRLYVGVHYPTDVLVGMIMGTLIAVTVCKIYEKHQKSRIL